MMVSQGNFKEAWTLKINCNKHCWINYILFSIIILASSGARKSKRFKQVSLINVRENRRCNQDGTIRRHWQQWAHKTKTNTTHNRQLKRSATQTLPKTGCEHMWSRREIRHSCFTQFQYNSLFSYHTKSQYIH